MTRDPEEPLEGYGLLACGSSGGWTIDLDQSADGTKLCLELDGPLVYLVFEVDNVEVIKDVHEYLRSRRPVPDALPFGHFATGRVSLHWDNEEGERCFLIVGPKARSTLRLTLSADDAMALADALKELLSDLLPDTPRE